MYLFIFVEYLGRLFLAIAKPLETVHTPPGAIGNSFRLANGDYIGLYHGNFPLCWDSMLTRRFQNRSAAC